ncbi:MAG: hypothetical protein ICV84_09225 [Flavisolibacter sp.]|nr:hypothetical protein [Flavisolibacter sp.]
MKKEAFRTEKVNLFFSVNASLNSLSEDDINKQGGFQATLFVYLSSERLFRFARTARARFTSSVRNTTWQKSGKPAEITSA